MPQVYHFLSSGLAPGNQFDFRSILSEMTPIEIKVTPLGIFIGYAATVLVCAVFGAILLNGNTASSLENIFTVLFGILFGIFCACMTYRSLVHYGVYMKIDERGIWHKDLQDYILWSDIDGYGSDLSHFRHWLQIFTRKPTPWPQPSIVTSIESVLLKIIPGLKPIPRTAHVASLELYPFSNLSCSQISKLLEDRGVIFHE